MNDEEFKMYIENKNRNELNDILYSIDHDKHPTRVEYNSEKNNEYRITNLEYRSEMKKYELLP